MATAKTIKNIFLSASIPLPEIHATFIETADIIAIRDAILAFTSVVLPHHRIIWGGHPSITPLIYYVMEKLDMDIQNHVNLYQSLWFKECFPEDNDKFENVIYTDKGHDIHSSVEILRNQMIKENSFSAAVFIGGMEGIEMEFKIFKEYHPKALLLPIASTGAATKIVYDELLPQNSKNSRLEKDYGYMSLFQDLLLERI